MIRLRPTAAFTLVELILVMALLATVMALSAPSLSRSLRQRHLQDEATRFLALAEYSRNEAVSQGVPMTVWIDPTAQRYGVGAKAGFEGAEARNRDFAVNPDIHFELDKAATNGGVVDAIEFAPDGTPTLASIDAVRLVDRFESVITVARTSDGWGYEILKEAK
jgi:type II secretion system protein H